MVLGGREKLVGGRVGREVGLVVGFNTFVMREVEEAAQKRNRDLSLL